MKNLILCAFFILAMGCKIDNSKTQNAIASIDTEVSKPDPFMKPIGIPNVSSEPYELKLNSHKIDAVIYDLEISMVLNNNAHFVSPNAKRDFLGKFTIIIDDNNNFKLHGNLIETPLSVEENDLHPFVNGLVNWVRINTTYKQQLKVITPGDFQVKGMIQFTIEPRCTLEKIPIIIKYENGEMKFEIFQC